ncbi:MAG: hypothetical protein U0Z70_08915 [Thermomicrobiales bacterium]
MSHRRPNGNLNGPWLLRCCATTIAIVLALSLGVCRDVAAKAPPHATTIVTTGVFATPDLTGDQIGTITQGTELQLTGEAAPGFLGVIYGEAEAWVPSTNLTTGVRPGVETAMAIVDAPLTDAPMRNSGIVSYVPEGESVILTGASVDGYYAASYNGTGGWISGRDIAR